MRELKNPTIGEVRGEVGQNKVISATDVPFEAKSKHIALEPTFIISVQIS